MGVTVRESQTQQEVIGWDAPVCGMTWGWTAARGTWLTAEAEHSMSEMMKLNTNWVTLAYAAVQDTAQSTRIPSGTRPP
jgi:hypothetical protein